MLQSHTAKIRLTATLLGLALLSGCVTPPPPPPPPPPAPPPVKIIPPRPVPPGGATANMYIPPRDMNGIRQTVNYGISIPQTVWNFRSGLNVAALNCTELQYAPILTAYRGLLNDNKRALTRANDQLTAQYRAQYGNTYRNQFDGYMTQVYNYYALPPAKYNFCEASLAVSNAYLAAPPADLESFAMSNLPQLERVFVDFYEALEKYQADVVAWDAQYGTPVPTGFAPMPTNSGLMPAPSFQPDIRTVDVPPSTATIGAAEGTVPEPGFNNTAPPVFVSEPVVEPVPAGNGGGSGG